MKGWVIAVLAITAAVLGLLAFLFAQGAPTQPSAQLYTQIQPNTAQGLLVQIQFGFYSIVAPNNIWTPGFHIIYSAVERSTAGAPVVLVNNGTAAPNIASSSGQFYTMSITLQITTVAACSGGACVGVMENLTVTAEAAVVTPYIAWFSPITTAVFSSSQGGCSSGTPCQSLTNPVAAPPTPSAVAMNSWYLELFVPLTVLAAVVGLVLLVVGVEHWAPAMLVGAAIVLVIVEFAVW
jgi:hypothetical protein